MTLRYLGCVMGMLATAPALAQGSSPVHDTTLATPGTTPIIAEMWVDNWFRLYANGKALIEDSVPLTTARSFNAERVTFNADLPLTLAFEFRDFMQNDTGLEYIGTDHQQMGDGGAIAQFRDAATGDLLAVTDAGWHCRVIQQAPLSDACADLANPVAGEGDCAASVTAVAPDWVAPAFDDSTWPAATTHSARSVGPKDGYDQIDWVPQSAFIWGPDLHRDNVVLCRTTISR